MDTKEKKATGQTKQRRPGNTKTAPARRKVAQRTAPVRKKAPARKQEKRDVVYTPASPFNRGRFVLRLVTVVAVVLAVLFGMSIFFKVKTVNVAGNVKYTAWDVMEASGIKEGDNLLTFGKAKACGMITAKLPYVESVRIGIKLPDVVNIEIKELEVVYAIRDESDDWWMITADGKVVEKTDNTGAGERTKVLGIQISSPQSGSQAVAVEPEPQATGEDGATVPVTIRGSEQLDAALTILQYLEQNGILGEVVSVDVTDMGNIELWYGQQYQVKLGDTTQLAKKIQWLAVAVKSELKEYDNGVLDISFTLMPDDIIHESFDE